MSAGHTPGPWFAHPIHVRDNYAASKPMFSDGLWHIRRQSDPETCPIAEIDRGDDHDAPTRAQAEDDARLIAAAPDLLADLVMLVSLVATDARYAGSGCVKMANATIAKATGAPS